MLPFVHATIGDIETTIQEIQGLGFQTPYFENRLQEAYALIDDDKKVSELTREVLLQKEEMISLVELTKSLEGVIQVNNYGLSVANLYGYLNQNDFEAAEAELKLLVDQIAQIEEGKALGGLVNIVSFSARIKAFLFGYKYFVLAIIIFMLILFFLSYKTLEKKYLQFRIQRLEREFTELHNLEREIQDKYYNWHEISKKDFDLAVEKYTKRMLVIEELLIDLRDKFSE